MRDKVIMALSRNVQYILAGALAVYIVFFTRPAPSFVVHLLSSPLSQLAVLGLVVFVGAQVSLLVAVVAAIAVVLSIPGREYMTDQEIIKTYSAKQKTAHNSLLKVNKKITPLRKARDRYKKTENTSIAKIKAARKRIASRSKSKTPKAANSVKSKFTNPGVEGFDMMGGGPQPAGELGAPMGGEAKGSENFSLLNSSPF
jgi:hypothetical protein